MFFVEGEHVDFVGDGADGIPPAPGRIVAIASERAVHVQWLDGPRNGGIDLVETVDLEKSASAIAVEAQTITTHSVRRAMNSEGEIGVLNFLASARQTDSWTDIAHEALGFVESKLRSDGSMDLPYEQLRSDEVDSVVTLAARTLLAQAFGE